MQPVLEGDELVEYVIVELPTNVDLAPGSKVQLVDLSSENPKIKLEDGSVLEGCYEESLGTIMIYERHATSSSAAGDASQPIQLRGLTMTKLVTKVQMSDIQPTLPGSNLS